MSKLTKHYLYIAAWVMVTIYALHTWGVIR